jgi:hypothetical protein
MRLGSLISVVTPSMLTRTDRVSSVELQDFGTIEQSFEEQSLSFVTCNWSGRSKGLSVCAGDEDQAKQSGE